MVPIPFRYSSRMLLHCLAASSRRRGSEIGIPVGTVELSPQHVHSFRLLLEDVLKQPIRFRGVDKKKKTTDNNDKDDDDDDVIITVHLPTLVAASLEGGDHPQLTQFLQDNSGKYLPGVRKRCPTLDLDLHQLPIGNSIINNSRFRFVELFAGIGGFRLGLEQIGGKCVLSNEINPDVAAIYKTNFNLDNDDCVLAVGDIIDICSENLPEFDCLVGGFPCQPFTKRGNQLGLLDDNHRGQLYQELARILKNRQPKCFLFENVPGLVTLDGGKRTVSTKGQVPQFESGNVFKRILDTFRFDCGYQVDWHVLNSRKWLPQMRERVYIVGIRNDLLVHCPKSSFFFNWENLILKDLKDECPTTVRDILEHKDSPSVLSNELTKEQYTKLLQKNASSIGRINLDDKAPTLISQYHSVTSKSTKFIMEEADGTQREIPRFLTPRECTRLMGFPENFIIPSESDEHHDHDNNNKVNAKVSHYYHAIGNAVCPNVIASIGEELITQIEKKKWTN